jgi:hypothetical protein
MIEELIEHVEGKSKRWWITLVGSIVLVLAVFGVGLNTITSGLLKGPKTAGSKHSPSISSAGVQGTTASGDKLTDITNANFAYMKAKDSADWTLNLNSQTFEQKKGLVKYVVKLANAGTLVTISQQAMPAQLLPRDSKNFNQFIESNKPTRSVDAGSGKLYFLPALQNGVLANGADTVIFATDNVLLFGRAERVVGYDGWTKLLGAMKPVF